MANRTDAILVVLACFAFGRAAADSPNYDGIWWHTISAGEQERFLDGLSDCYIYDAHGKHALSPADVAAKTVSAFYNRQPGQRNESVLTVFRGLPDKDKWSAARHGYFDGDYWRMLESREKVSFVRGYLACRSVYLKSTAAKPASSCADRISAWYRVGGPNASDVIDSKTAADKVGDILTRICR